MTHYIIVKFRKNVDINYQRVSEIFSVAGEIDGVEGAVIKRNCIDRDNRWDLMIEITMEKEALALYDDSEMHLNWKKEFSDQIAEKAIFDSEG